MRLAILAMAAALATAAPLTAQQDHQRVLDELHITALRPGVDGNDPKAPNAANYDEAKANPSPNLPDPLKLHDGTPVTTTDQWWQQRRGEIADDFERQVYGRLPDPPPVVWKAADAAPETVGRVAATTRHVVGYVTGPRGGAVQIGLTLSLPAKTKGPVPVILLLSAVGAKPGAPSTWREQVLAKGWGAAVLDVASVQPDDGADLGGGIIGLAAGGKPRALGDWGVLRAWGWGASRALDYLETNEAIDAAHVGIAGHSRYGKAALVAMAFDPRFVVAYISSSGAGGAGLLRRNFGERIENLASVGEYHWFAGNFLQYAGPKTAADLPVDAHELIAMCAPRGVFVGAGSKGDNWVDARGMFLAEVAAAPVYALLHKTGLGTATMPPIGQAVASGQLAFRQHTEGHTPEPNWPAFLSFAQRFLQPVKAPKKG